MGKKFNAEDVESVSLYEVFDSVFAKDSYKNLILCCQCKALLAKDYNIGAQINAYQI